MVDFSRLPIYLGAVTVSPAAMAALSTANEPLVSLLIRHAAGEWGEIDEDERTDNWVALAGADGLVCGVHRLTTGVTVMIATEMNPRQTSVILADEV